MILIIDDDQSVRILTERLVKTFGLTSVAASNGEEGIALLEAHCEEIGAVVLDLTMPKLNGEETFLKLRSVKPGLPIIFTSGYERAAQVVRDRNTDFLQKPFKRNELREKLEKHLEQKTAAA